MQSIAPTDPRLNWAGAISLETTASSVQPWRIEHSCQGWFPPELCPSAQKPAGVRLTFVSDTGSLRSAITPAEGKGGFDLFLDGQPVASFELNDESSHFEFANLPPVKKLFELWLPQWRPFALLNLEMESGAVLESPPPDSRPRWITYGSSITHCGSALSPSRTWPAIAARHFDWNLTCLGFGGQCHLDIAIARLIRDQPADRISICAGINIYGASTLGPRTFVSNLKGTVELIREKHPETPLLLISPIFSSFRETTVNALGWTLADYRQAVGEVAALVRGLGDRHLHYLDGLDLFGEDCASLLPDELHPSGEGYVRMGENFIRTAPRPWVEGV